MNDHLAPTELRMEAPPDPADVQALRDNLGTFNVHRAAIDQG